ncbi:hypothetical protein GCM10010191_79360 [Actinomadura vinacea]|uniref:Membrane-associated oxidoreductase n=1 Tax=Actinomadura vinacea TaxID=115336 RepID=A0ABN3K8D9_9ACTN
MAEWRLGAAEQRVWSAFPRGEWVDLRTGDSAEDDPSAGAAWDDGRVVRGEVIAALLLGAVPPDPGRRPAIRLSGARIEGRLDLMGAEVPYTLVCEHCHFDGPIRLVEATTRTIRITGSDIHSINAPRLVLDGLLNLHRSTVRHGLRLDRARVNGEITLRAARIAPDAEGVAVAADGLVVDGEMEANHGFRATGAVRLRNARIEGRLGLEDAVVEAPGGMALTLDRATVNGGLIATGIAVEGMTVLRGTRIEGRLDLQDARVNTPAGTGRPALDVSRATVNGGLMGSRLTVDGETALRDTRVSGGVHLDAAVLRNREGPALGAGGLAVEGPLLCRDGFTAEGGILLPGAQIRSVLALRGASLAALDGTALDLGRASLGELDGTALEVSAGTVNLSGAQVANHVGLSRARLRNDGVALTADNAAVGATFDCGGMRAQGEVRAVLSRIGGRLLLQDAHLENPGGKALRLSRAEIAADVFGNRTVALGMVKLTGARIGGRLDLKPARLSAPGGVALHARGLQASEFVLRPSEPVEGTVILEHARIGVLHDDPGTWPEALSLNGLTYESLEPRLPARDRLRWLALDPGARQPQPYEHLAAHYTALGQHGQARQVLLAKERLHHRRGTPIGRVWGVLQDAAVGYGYQPWRAVLWLGLLVTAGALVYGAEPPKPLKPGEAPHFNPVVYALDLLLPLVDLGQERAFNPAGGYQWFSYALVAAGWILVTVIAAAVARVLSRR